MNNTRKAYDKELQRIEDLAAPLYKWRNELNALETKRSTLKEQRLAALANEDLEQADRLASLVAAAEGRAEDLAGMIALRSAEIDRALVALWDQQGRAVALAEIGRIDEEVTKTNAVIAELAPKWAAAQALAQKARTDRWIVAQYNADSLDIQNRARFVAAQRARLVGGDGAPYAPSWLQ